MPVIFLSAVLGALLALWSLWGGMTLWEALAIYGLGGATIAMGAFLGAMLGEALAPRAPKDAARG